MNLPITVVLNYQMNLPITVVLNYHMNSPITDVLNYHMNLPMTDVLNYHMNLPITDVLNYHMNSPMTAPKPAGPALLQYRTRLPDSCAPCGKDALFRLTSTGCPAATSPLSNTSVPPDDLTTSVTRWSMPSAPTSCWCACCACMRGKFKK